MKLLSLEIEGFKSFGKRTFFNLDKNVIAIIGPNGSGKSNIVDAIRWLLGEQSQKRIRISEKDDVLHIGSNGSDSSSVAKVSLVVENEKSEKIKITKIMEKDSSNKYYINNKVSTLKELQNLFNKGAGKSFYSIIGQGQIGEIVNSSPESIRDVVLDASNIAGYLEKKERSISLLDKANENLERINDLLFVIDKRLKSLSIRAGRAKKHIEYKEEIKRIGKKYFGATKVKYLKGIETLEQEKENNSQKIKELLSNLFDIERSYRSLKDEIESVDKQLSLNGDMIENYRQRLRSIETEKVQLTEELNSNNSSMLSKQWEMNSLKEKIENLEEQLRQITIQEEKFRKEKETNEQKTNSIDDKKNKILEDLNIKERTIKELEYQLQNIIKKNLVDENKFKELEKKHITNEERISLLDEQIESLKSQLEKNSQKLEEVEEILAKSEGSEKKIETSLKEEMEKVKKIENYCRTLTIEIDSLQQKEKNLYYTHQSLDRQINEYEGYSSTIKDFFKYFNNDPNVVDVVANLIETDEKYEEAVSTIAGARLQNIVIKESSKAKDYLNVIKKNNNGKITFLPLDLLKIRVSLQKSFLNEPGTIDFVINIVNYNNEYKKVMEYVFSNSLLVVDIETAIKLSKINYPGNIVTLGGELVYSSGAITGGKSKYDHSSTILKRKRELEDINQQLQSIKEQLNTKENEFKKWKEELIKRKEKVESIKDELREITSKKNIHNFDYKKIKEEVKNLENNIAQYTEKKFGYEQENEDIAKNIMLIKQERQNNTQETSQITKKINDLKEEVQKSKNNLNQIEKELLEKSMELKSVKEKYEYYKNQKINIEKELKETKINLEETEKIHKNLKEKNVEIKKSIEDLSEESETLNSEISKLFDMMKQSRTGKHDKSKDLEKYENQINQLKEKVNSIKQKNQEIEFEIKETNHNIEFLKEKAQNLDIIENEYELKELPNNEIKALENKLNDLENSLKKLGSVDLTVLDEYEEVEKEYKENLKNKEDILSSINSLKKTIKTLDEEAENQFNAFFNSLNQEFSQFISKLFPNGYGELKLDGEGKNFEKGIQISVKKAGSNFQKLSLFSGGEKALIAIAFLFAIMSLNPSPFYILDEIDAPLDDLNASKIADLILENSKKSQFLIITHNKIVMEIAEIFYGITMREGITYLVPVDFKELER
ncbi:hypothetical protein PW5551_06950 [Petrotoga sp. 9PW.55.5.1]|uniref:chromosome segregation protein SMC n=1 Tax=Petrotoga sp. 9PW.55.5.1 TaxID=1308979 RepID=UPI000DC23E11|nr:chromosome segregation protein SMC [Petrotoga sp. 9PW.55.5.1]RAO98930.1 hypothetical protein PW5551_06950 [Petrotoga sp. 9PW.55.5.1]